MSSVTREATKKAIHADRLSEIFHSVRTISDVAERELDATSDVLKETRDRVLELESELRDVKERANGYWERCREERGDREEAEVRHSEDIVHLLSRIGQAIGELDKGKCKKARKILMATLDETPDPTPTPPPF